MEYQVPQFIEVEDKIFGPFTFKQFVYLAGGAGAAAIALLYLPLVFGVLLAIPVAALGAALAFYKMNGKPFIDILEAAFNYVTSKKLYLWRKEAKTARPAEAVRSSAARDALAGKVAPLTRGKLRDLAWSLDVKDSVQLTGDSAQP
ncbi:PrgI family protein [Patescibacteria group bacterium]|nr:PrgI family protein [Patescibacteria group bacterium]